MPLAFTCDDPGFLQPLCRAIEDRGFSGSDVIGLGAQKVLQSLIVFVLVMAVGRLLRNLTLRAAHRTNTDAQIRTLVNNVFTIVTLVTALLAALTTGGLSINVLLTFGGLASLALGLAFQDLLRNILAGIFLLIEQPFRIGDLITVGNHSGTVQTIQLRTTALRTPDGRLAILPNLEAFAGTVVNSTAYDMRQFSLSVRLPAGADLAAAVRTVRSVVAGHAAVAAEPKPFVQPRIDSDGGLTVSARYWVEYRRNDPDALSAELVGDVYEALSPWPGAPPQPPTPGVAAG
jgi:small conductance mechanosensitive channel